MPTTDAYGRFRTVAVRILYPVDCLLLGREQTFDQRALLSYVAEAENRYEAQYACGRHKPRTKLLLRRVGSRELELRYASVIQCETRLKRAEEVEILFGVSAHEEMLAYGFARGGT
jgi:hypothetical protein